MKPEIIVAVLIGTVVMFGIMLICRKWRKSIPVWKLLIIAPILTVFGTAGAYVLYFIENMKWGGISFYGSLFMIPLLFIPTSFIIKENYGEILDYCAPSVCIMLAINKVNCIRTGCCKGRVIHTDAEGIDVRFPSQIVELCTVLVIMVILLILINKGKLNKIVYPAFLVIYGVTRFGLNLLRDTTPFLLGLSAGCFWSVIAVIIGIIWIFIFKTVEKKRCRKSETIE